MRFSRDPALALAAEVADAARHPSAARMLWLDLDGTLAPIVLEPQDARVPPRTAEALGKLARGGWSVAVISGRPAAQVEALVPTPGVRIFGSHGLEDPRGVPSGPRLLPRERARLSALGAGAAALAAGIPGARVEIKPAGIAFHERRVPRADLARWRGRVRSFLRARDLAGLEILRGRSVVELRPAGAHKGRVLEAALLRGGFARPDASLVAVGDDRTDEDLFRAIRGIGLAVRVGRCLGGSLAHRRLPSPAAVGRFLEALASVSLDEGTAARAGARA